MPPQRVRMPDHRDMLESAERHLGAACPHMRELIQRLGPCRLQLQPDGFQMLVRSITSQQISSHAARSILRRLLAGLEPHDLAPDAVRKFGMEGLRGCGYSARKASYVLGIATAVTDGVLDFEELGSLADEEVVERLTRLRGVGEWTAHMFLIFSLGRPDVFPHGDLGVRSALRNFHGLEELPDKSQAIRLAVPWRPFASIASWYCWRSLDAPAVAGTA